MSQFDMRDEHHDPEKFPEWKDPHGSSIKHNHEYLLEILGYSEDDISVFLNDLKEIALLEELA